MSKKESKKNLSTKQQSANRNVNNGTVKQNKTGMGSMRSNPDGSLQVTRRERVTDMSASTVLTLAKTFIINPGLSTFFPWLSVLAQAYESYKFQRLCFRFKPSVSDFTNGGFFIVPEYNVNETAPDADRGRLSQYQNSLQGRADREICINLDPKSLSSGKSRHFIRVLGLEITSDLSLYDVANVFVFPFGADSGVSSFGDIWVEYTVTLYTPQPPDQILSTAVPYIAVANDQLMTGDPEGYLEAFPGSAMYPVDWYGSIPSGITIVDHVDGPGYDLILPKPGTYYLYANLVWNGSSTFTEGPTLTGVSLAANCLSGMNLDNTWIEGVEGRIYFSTNTPAPYATTQTVSLILTAIAENARYYLNFSFIDTSNWNGSSNDYHLIQSFFHITYAESDVVSLNAFALPSRLESKLSSGGIKIKQKKERKTETKCQPAPEPKVLRAAEPLTPGVIVSSIPTQPSSSNTVSGRMRWFQ